MRRRCGGQRFELLSWWAQQCMLYTMNGLGHLEEEGTDQYVLPLDPIARYQTSFFEIGR